MYKICVLFGLLTTIAVGYDVKSLSSDIWLHPYAPYYDAEFKRLYIVDFLNGTIINYDLPSNRVLVAALPGIPHPSFLIPMKKYPNQYLTSNHLSATVIEWNGFDPEAKVIRETFTVETAPDHASNNWNVAVAAPNGDFFGGTFRGNICGNTSAPLAGAYRYSKRCGVHNLNLPNIKSSSGFAFNIQGDRLYHIASCNYVIREFHYDKRTGKVAKGRIVFNSQTNYGGSYKFMIGLTIDTDGNLYATIYGGGVILKINPRTSKIVQTINIPAEVVLAATWGGDNYDMLFVPTASVPLDLDTGATSNETLSPDSGKVFVVTGLNARGFPVNKICI